MRAIHEDRTHRGARGGIKAGSRMRHLPEQFEAVTRRFLYDKSSAAVETGLLLINVTAGINPAGLHVNRERFPSPVTPEHMDASICHTEPFTTDEQSVSS